MSYIQNAIEIAKKLKVAADAIKDADMKLLLADLTNSLADLKLEIAGLKHENRKLSEKLSENQKLKDIRACLESRDGVYYFKEPHEGRPSGPYCPNCFDNYEKLVMIGKHPMSGRFGRFLCSQCNQTIS